MQRTAAILSIGDELTLGQSLDTNSRHIAERLTERGIVPIEHATVDDHHGRLVQTLHRLAAAADVVLCTGGLGPTADDCTRAALAEATGDALVEDADARVHIETWFAGRGRAMPETNLVQALRPSRGRMLDNPHGTAPGIAATLKTTGGTGVPIFAMPGPPREMRPMLDDQVMPALEPDPARVVRTRLLRCFGIGESDVAQQLGDLMHRDRNPLVGTTASLGVCTVRMRFEGAADAAGAEAALDDAEARVRAILGAHVVGPKELPAEVVHRLADRGETLAVAESCTAGLVAATVTEVPGASEVFAGGFITYADAAKHGLLGVPESVFRERDAGGVGAVSSACAISMARGCLTHAIGGWAGAQSHKPTHAVSVTGIAGPGGGSEEKPVGTVWIGRASADGSAIARRFQFRGDRDAVRSWATRAALSCVWAKLAEADELTLLREIERVTG